MGSSSSKIAGKAVGAATHAGRRQYPSTSSILRSTPAPLPTQTPTSTSTPSTSASSPPSQPSADAVPNRPLPSSARPSDTKSEQVELDGRDAQFDSALRKIGPAQPPSTSRGRPREDAFPTSSQPMQPGQNIFPSSTNNPAVRLVQARERIGRQWDLEAEQHGRPKFPGRTLLSATEIREALSRRDEAGQSAAAVEKQMQLKGGILDRMAAKGMVANA